MGIKGRRVHMIEELSETIISFQRGKKKKHEKWMKKKILKISNQIYLTANIFLFCLTF